MKKAFILLLTSISITMMARDKIKIVTSIPDLADFAAIVGGKRVEVEPLIRGQQNPHYLEVKPSYMLKLKSASLFLVVGMKLELWSQQIIDGSRNSVLKVIDCPANIPKLEVPSTALDASYSDVHPDGNPHYWLDPENVKEIIKTITSILSQISPLDRQYFEDNAERYREELDAKMIAWKKSLEPFKRSQLVSYHSIFNCFAKRFDLDVAGYIELKPGISPSPAHTAELIFSMRKNGVKVIGLEQYFEENTAEQIAKATGEKVIRFATSVNGRQGTESYLKMIDYNVRSLVNALN
ncbi:MAG: metal ABC transporter substrate-binding protein [bacterium]